jgi:hypothetical protein
MVFDLQKDGVLTNGSLPSKPIHLQSLITMIEHQVCLKKKEDRSIYKFNGRH